MKIALAAIVLLLAATQPAGPLESSLARTRQALETQVPESERASLTQRLDRASAADRAGRSYLSFYLLEAPFESASAFEFANAAGITTAEAFVRAWTRAGAPKPSLVEGRRPAFVDALADAAEGRALATYQASRPFAEDAGIDAGLYYLGESRALMSFAALARALRWPAPAARPPFRSIAPEIAALDREMTAQYETMSQAEHPAYISASAALKQARSLDASGRHEAALFEYLLSRYLFAPLRGAAATEATPAAIAAARASLGRERDDSIIEFFLQLADEGVSGDVPAQRRGAAAALDDVLPAYIAAVAPPRVMTRNAAAPRVTITLVRWPFT
jgi:hypothetical protein